MTVPLSPRSQICQELQSIAPCEISWRWGNSRFADSITDSETIKEAFDRGARIMLREYRQYKDCSTLSPIVNITAFNFKGKRIETTFDLLSIRGLGVPRVESNEDLGSAPQQIIHVLHSLPKAALELPQIEEGAKRTIQRGFGYLIGYWASGHTHTE